MIEELHISNYKCFKDLVVPLKRLTVAIGANNTGKSTFLEVLPTLNNNGRYRFRRIGVGVGFQGERADSFVELLAGDAAAPSISFALPPAGPPMNAVGVSDAEGTPPVALNFVAPFVDWCLRQDRDRFFKLVDAMKQAIPGLVDVLVSVPNPQTRRLDLKMEGGFVSPADQASAGTRTALFFQALLLHPRPPKLLLFDELENGLHPLRLGEVFAVLREVSKAGTQVVLTTHSPYLLDLVDPDEEQVLVFERKADGQCLAKPLDVDKIRVFLDEFGLGEVWSNEREEGLV